MKTYIKIIIGVVITTVIVTAVWLIFLRPSDISQESVTQSFELHKSEFATVATYLTENNISADITGAVTDDNSYGISQSNDNSYHSFTEAVKLLMYDDCTAIVSDGKTVEFSYDSSGGFFNKLNASVIYNGEDKVDAKITVPLSESGWHLYIYTDDMVKS